MLDAAGRDRAQVGIRSTVWDPDTRIVDKGPTTLQILAGASRRTATSPRPRPGSKTRRGSETQTMAEDNLSARLVEIESMLDRSRRRFEEGTRLVEEAHKMLGRHPAGADRLARAASRPRTARRPRRGCSRRSRRAAAKCPRRLCGGRLAVDQVQRLIRIDGHPIGITEMEYRVLELLAFARNNVVTRAMLLKHLYRRADDQPQPKIIDVFISKLRKKLRNASRRRGVHRDDPAARLDPARHRREAAAPEAQSDSSFVSRCSGLARWRCFTCSPIPDAASRRPEPYAEAVSRLASVRQALRLVDPFGGGPGVGPRRRRAIAAAWDDAGDAKQRAVRQPLGAAGRRDRGRARGAARRAAATAASRTRKRARRWSTRSAASSREVAAHHPAARPGPIAFGVAGSAPHSLQLPS